MQMEENQVQQMVAVQRDIHGNLEVMSPRFTGEVHGAEDERIRAQTVTVANGPGFQLRQVSQLMMDESTTRALQELLSPQRDTSALRSDMEMLAAEFIRVTNLIGGAVNTLAQTAQAQDQRIGRSLQEWCTHFEQRVKEVWDTGIPNGKNRQLNTWKAAFPKCVT